MRIVMEGKSKKASAKSMNGTIGSHTVGNARGTWRTMTLGVPTAVVDISAIYLAGMTGVHPMDARHTHYYSEHSTELFNVCANDAIPLGRNELLCRSQLGCCWENR